MYKLSSLILFGFFGSLLSGRELIYVTDCFDRDTIRQTLEKESCPADLVALYTHISTNNVKNLECCFWKQYFETTTRELKWGYKISGFGLVDANLDLELQKIRCFRKCTLQEFVGVIAKYYEDQDEKTIKAKKNAEDLVSRITEFLSRYSFKEMKRILDYTPDNENYFLITIDTIGGKSVVCDSLDKSFVTIGIGYVWHRDETSFLQDFAEKFLDQQSREAFLQDVLTDSEKQAIYAKIIAIRNAQGRRGGLKRAAGTVLD